MHEGIRAFRCSRGLRTGQCAERGRRCYRLLRNIRRRNGRHRSRRTSVLLDYSHWTHYRSSQGHAAPGVEICHGAAGRIFDGRGERCLCGPTTDGKFRCMNFRWRGQRCLRSIRSAINSTRYLSGPKSQGLARVVWYLHRTGGGRNGVGQNDGTALRRLKKSAGDCDAANKQQETYVETRGHRGLRFVTRSTAETPRMCRGFRTGSFSVAVVVKAYGEPGRQLGGRGIAVVRRQFKSPPIMTHRGAAVMRGCAVSGLPDGGRCASSRGTRRSIMHERPSIPGAGRHTSP